MRARIRREEIELEKETLKQEELTRLVQEKEVQIEELQSDLTCAKESGFCVGVANDAAVDHNQKQQCQIDKLDKMIEQNQDQIE